MKLIENYFYVLLIILNMVFCHSLEFSLKSKQINYQEHFEHVNLYNYSVNKIMKKCMKL